MRNKRVRTRLIETVIGLTTLALTATACSDSGHSEGKSGEVILRAEASPAGQITRNFNPFNTQAPVALLGGWSLINEPLFITNPVKENDITPWLAKSWEFAPDGMSMTMTLNSGVNWTDGLPFTADDVAFTFNLIRDNPGINTTGLQLKGATALAPDRVRIDFPLPGYAQETTVGHVYIVPRHLWEGKDPATFTFDNPVGTGPFVLDGKTFTPQGYLLRKNPRYWQPDKPKIDGIRFVSYSSNTSANLALKKGELEWASNFVNDIEKEYVNADKANNKYWFPPVTPVFLCGQLNDPKYRNPKTRLGISAALDRDKLVAIAEQNEQPAAKSPTGLLPQHEQHIADRYRGLDLKQDLPKAKQLLAEAGWKAGADGMLADASGKKFEITLTAPSGFTDIMTMWQVVVEQLKAVGITAKVQSMTTQQWIADGFTGNYDMSACARFSGVNSSPFDYYQNLLAGYLTKPIGQPAFGNTMRWRDDGSTDRLLTQYASTKDPAQRKQALEGLQQIMVEQAPAIPLFNFVAWSEYSTKRVTGWPSADNPYTVAAVTGPTAVLVATRLEPKKK